MNEIQCRQCQYYDGTYCCVERFCRKATAPEDTCDMAKKITIPQTISRWFAMQDPFIAGMVGLFCICFLGVLIAVSGIAALFCFIVAIAMLIALNFTGILLLLLTPILIFLALASVGAIHFILKDCMPEDRP